jgi:hypothetical protein
MVDRKRKGFPWCAPERIRLTHLTDQRAEVRRHRRPAGPPRSGFPAPMDGEGVTMPPDDRGRPDDLDGVLRATAAVVRPCSRTRVSRTPPIAPDRRSRATRQTPADPTRSCRCGRRSGSWFHLTSLSLFSHFEWGQRSIGNTKGGISSRPFSLGGHNPPNPQPPA